MKKTKVTGMKSQDMLGNHWNEKILSKVVGRIRSIFFFLLVMTIGLQSFSCITMAQEKKSSFKDIKGSEWFAKDVLDLAGNTNGIIKGFPDGTFGAEKKLGVDQFITMLVRAAGEKAENHSEYWAINYLHKAKEMGILKEGDFTDFKAQIKREEMAVLIIRFMEKREKIENIEIDGVESLIMDYEMIGQGPKKRNLEQREAVKKNYVLGLLTGYEDANFHPTRILTRAEAATVVVRLLNPNRRVKFQPEVLKEKREKEMEKHYYGGSKWVNPADANIEKLTRVKEDWKLTSGKLDYSPKVHTLVQNSKYYTFLSVDDVRGVLHYDENGPEENQIEDFEQLLRRRMPKSDVSKIINYLRKKTTKYTHLEHAGTDFFVNDGKYMVRLEETITSKNTSYTISFNIIYRDSNWNKLYKETYDYNYYKIW